MEEEEERRKGKGRKYERRDWRKLRTKRDMEAEEEKERKGKI